MQETKPYEENFFKSIFEINLATKKYDVDIASKSFRNPFLKHTQYSNKNVFQLNIIPSIIILNDNQLKSKIVKGKCSPFYDNFS